MQNQNCHFIDKLIVDGISYEGSENILNAVHEKMSEELKYYGNLGLDDDVTDEEQYFLNFLPKIELTQKQKDYLKRDIDVQEVSIILESQCDPDSAPDPSTVKPYLLVAFGSAPFSTRY